MIKRLACSPSNPVKYGLGVDEKNMKEEFWTVTQVTQFFQIEDAFLDSLEEEEIVCPICREAPPSKVYPPGELEKVRVAKILVEDMGVNLAGVEVILQMRRRMIEMRKQFDDILEALAQDLRETLKNP